MVVCALLSFIMTNVASWGFGDILEVQSTFSMTDAPLPQISTTAFSLRYNYKSEPSGRVLAFAFAVLRNNLPSHHGHAEKKERRQNNYN